MEETVKTLVLQLPEIIKKHTKTEYPDMKKALASLQDYVQNTDWTTSGLMGKLKVIQDILSGKNEKKKQLKDHFKKIEAAMDVGQGGNTGTNPSSGNNGKQKKVNPSTGGNSTTAQMTVTGSEFPVHPRSTAQHSKRDQDITSEIVFFEQNLACLLEMFKTDKGGTLTDMFKLPTEKQLKEKVKNGHDTLVRVGEEIRQMKFKKEHLEDVLQKLSSKVIVGNGNTTGVDENAFKLPNNVGKVPDIAAIYSNAAAISKKFQELNRDLNFACQRMSELLFAVKGQGEQEAGLTMNVQNEQAKGRNMQNKDPSMTPPILDQAKKIDNDFCQIQSELRARKQLIQEADYAAKLLEDLNNFILNNNSVEGTHILTKPDTTGSINEEKEKQHGKGKTNQSNNAPEETQQSRHARRIQNHFETAKSILHKHSDVRSQIDEKQFIESTMDDLSNDVQDLVEGKIKIGMHCALDQRTASIDKGKEGSKFQRLIQAKKIYELQCELQKEAKYAVLLLDELNKYKTNDKEYILTEPQIFASRDDGNQNQISRENKLKPVGEKQPSRHLLQLRKSFETALDILDKQIEAQYAAQLLKDLGNFSKKTEGDSDHYILSDPPTNVTQSRNGGKPRKEEISQQNKVAKEYLESATLILNQIKERQSLNIDIKTETKQKGQSKLQRLEEENSALKKEVDSLRTRLSQIAGVKLVHENPAIADLSDPNRPTKLGDKYSQLYDNQWTEAYSALQNDDKKASDEKLTGNLYNILIDIYRFCENKRKAQKMNLEDMLFYPAVNMESGLRRQREGVSEILAKHLNDALKVSCDVASLNMVHVFKTDKAMRSKYGKRMQLCKSFIEESVKLCWLMQIQTPPLCIDTKTARGDELVKDKYKEYTAKGQKIAFVVWPALFLHENGPLVAKGVAQGE